MHFGTFYHTEVGKNCHSYHKMLLSLNNVLPNYRPHINFFKLMKIRSLISNWFPSRYSTSSQWILLHQTYQCNIKNRDFNGYFLDKQVFHPMGWGVPALYPKFKMFLMRYYKIIILSVFYMVSCWPITFNFLCKID